MTDIKQNNDKPARIDWNELMRLNSQYNEPLARTPLRFNLSDAQRNQFARMLETNVADGHLVSPNEIRENW